MRQTAPNTRQKIFVVVAIMVPITLLHFITGNQYNGPFPVFVNGYLMDILLPFSFYFLLCLSDSVLLQSWIVKGLLIFTAASAVELAQYKGIPLLGRTFDQWDFVMYGLGVILAILCDLVIFPRLFSFWKSRMQSPRSDAKAEDSMFVWRQN